MTANYHKYLLDFKQPSGTSRGTLTQKETYFIIINNEIKQGIGECGLFRGLSIDDRPDYENKLNWVCNHIDLGLEELLTQLIEFPSIQIGLEMAFKSLESHDPFELFPSKFTQSEDSIAINGLIWMGTESFMKQQIADKIDAGFSCIKMKIGAIDFQQEINLLKSIRNQFSSKDIELRVDANGAFHPTNALEKLKILSDYKIHSIEQPIKQGQIDSMNQLCSKTPLPIALDEELIGVNDYDLKIQLLTDIKPQYIILKPSLLGGFEATSEWIEIANKINIPWWITSALESNIGLSAIAQFTSTFDTNMYQGLGTGQLYTNNFECPLLLNGENLSYNNSLNWNLSTLND